MKFGNYADPELDDTDLRILGLLLAIRHLAVNGATTARRTAGSANVVWSSTMSWCREPMWVSDLVRVGGVGGSAHIIGCEGLGLPDEVHREPADLLAVLGELGGGQRGDRAGVQPAKE